jgi:hypothetical protein
LKIQQILHRQGKEQKSLYLLSCIVWVFTFSCFFFRHSVLGPVNEWQIQDCIDVHKLLETVFGDQDVANSKFQYSCTCIVSHATLFC